MEIRDLNDRASVRGAIRAHGRAWRAAYAELLPAAVLDRVTVDPDTATVDTWLERLPDADDPGVAYGSAVGGTVRGYVYVRWGETKSFVCPGEADLKELYVHPDWWGGGLGTSLVSEALEAVPARFDGVALETLAGNDIGRSFYESRGFRLDGRSDIEIGDSVYETVVYRRSQPG